MSEYTQYNPKGRDYNKDGSVDYNDAVLAVQDKDKDGTLTNKEKSEYRQKQGENQVKYEYNAEGDLVSTTSKPTAEAPPEPGLDLSTFSKAFLKQHPGVQKIIERAIANDWPEDIFIKVVEAETAWGRNTTNAQAAFDLSITGAEKEDLLKQIEDRKKALIASADSAGIALTPAEAEEYARKSIRSGLTDLDSLGFISRQFVLPKTPVAGEPVAPGTTTPVLTGTSAEIVDGIKNAARRYGVTVNDQFIQRKTREALAKGGDWQTWLNGQENVFRQQAKNMYPKVADQFDTMSYEDLIDPYLTDAANLLGVTRNSLISESTDPKWVAALNGEQGAMSRDEWIRTLRSDKKYGFDKTTKARNEYTEVAADFLSMFGMG